MNLQDEVLVNHAENAVIYDVLPPMKYEGTKAYREGWDEWQPETVGPIMFDLKDFTITAGDKAAFACGFIHCGGTKPDGENFEDWARATLCFEKQNGKWLITHQHISKPVK